VTEGLDGRDRTAPRVIRVRNEAGDRRLLSRPSAIQQRQFRIHARVGAGAPAGTGDANRDVFGEDDVEDAVVRAETGDALPDRLLDLRRRSRRG
jgi:hypothetical protein